MRNGQYIAAYAPYGYRKSQDDKHKLAVDEEAAAVVRRMFGMRQSGASYGRIAATLNNDGILSPRWYWAVHYGSGSCKYAKLWTYATVKNILNNDIYKGNLIQNQTGHRSYKDGTMIYKPESEWITHEDAHEALISAETWEVVQEINRQAASISETRRATLPVFRKTRLRRLRDASSANRETRRGKNGEAKKYTSYFCAEIYRTRAKRLFMASHL